MKIYRENSHLVKIGAEYQAVYMKTQDFFFSRHWQRHMWHNDEQNTLLLCYDNAFNIYYIADRHVVCQKYKQDVLLRFHADDSYANAPRCYITLYRLSCYSLRSILTLNLLTWRIWWAPNNASKWQVGFNSAFKGLKLSSDLFLCLPRGEVFSGFHHAFLCILPHAQPIASFWFARPINIS